MGYRDRDAFQRFEEIHLAGKFLRVTKAPIEVEHDRFVRRELTTILHAILEERELAQLLPAPMLPEVEPCPDSWDRASSHQGMTRPYGCTEPSIEER